MRKTQEHQNAAERRPRPAEDDSRAVGAAEANLAEVGPVPTAVRDSPDLAGRGNAPVRAAMITQLQRTYGNRAVQRFLGPVAIQRALVDDVRAAWAPEPHDKGKVFAVLRRQLPPAAGAGPHKDSAVETCIDTIFPLKTNADDNWLAHRLLEYGGEANWPGTLLKDRATRAKNWAPEPGAVDAVLGETANHRSIQAFYFAGQTDRRALVIGGVHGSEQSGIEVAWTLVHDLSQNTAGTKRPYFTVIVVPELFPDSAAKAAAGNPAPGSNSNTGREPEKDKDPNRNFPAVDDPQHPPTVTGGAAATSDARGRAIYPENQILLQLIDRFQPERIASVHANRLASPLTYGKAGAGIFVDPAHAGARKPGDPLSPEDQLAADMAAKAQSGGARVPWNFVGDKRGTQTRYPTEATAHQPGVTFGTWAPKVGITVVTVEVLWYEPSSAFPTKAGAKPPQWLISQADRKVEIQAHADALREIFLGPGDEGSTKPLP